MGAPILQLLLDGAADRGTAAFEGLTPLQASKTPHLDVLAERGASGLMEVGPPGRPLHSPIAHGLLWGLNLDEIPPRSVLEAHGAGLPVRDHDALFFFYLVQGETRPEGWYVQRRLPPSPDVDPFEEYLPAELYVTVDDAKWHLTFHPLERPNSGVAFVDLEGADLPEVLRVTDSDPFEDEFLLIRPEPMQASDTSLPDDRVTDRYVRAVRDVIRRSADWLTDSSSYDFIAPKWHAAVREPDLPGVEDRWNLHAATDTYKQGVRGLANLMGMKTLEVKPESDYAGRVENALEACRTFDFVHCHFPEPDAPGHEGDPRKKRRVLERIDGALEPLVEAAEELMVCVTSDHSTPCESRGEHGGDSVPLLLCGPGTRVDDVPGFDEIAAAGGALGHVDATTLMPRLLDLTGRSLMYEVRRHPSDPVYRMPSSEVRPFRPDDP